MNVKRVNYRAPTTTLECRRTATTTPECWRTLRNTLCETTSDILTQIPPHIVSTLKRRRVFIENIISFEIISEHFVIFVRLRKEESADHVKHKITVKEIFKMTYTQTNKKEIYVVLIHHHTY